MGNKQEKQTSGNGAENNDGWGWKEIKIKDLVAMVESVAIVLSLIFAGYWFIFRGEASPKANISYEIKHKKINSEYIWLTIWVTLKNTGTIPIRLSSCEIEVEKILPFSGNNDALNNKIKTLAYNDKIEMNYNDYKKYKIEWEDRKRIALTDLKCVIDTGETQRFRYEFVYPLGIKTVKVYSHYKSFNTMGWSDTTVYEIDNKGEGQW